MTTLEKFISDIQKTIKYDRANNGGHYDGKRACTQIAKTFERYNPNLGTLANSIADYWLNTYILDSDNAANEPSEENLAKITAFQCFCDNITDSELDALNEEDWENLKELVDDAAEDIDLDTLQNMMSILLDRGAI